MSKYRLKGASGPVINQSFPLGARTLIGRADDCDLRIDHEQVSPRHAEIREQENGGLLLTQLDPAGEILLNGEAVRKNPLASGDEIRIANCRWVLQAPGLRPEKVLTSEAVRPRRGYLPWLIVAALMAAAAGAWYQGLLPF
ncbi:MAG: FHA domain-containing protein [Xanthomonadales bacterium]|nr:FHA domain-containing protein [Gammaproteobacteria bacterium]MBT8054909.1 FHA domain-containing protein [Gammaproteobacteria bacterium]NND57313.1 FHA domain-containing protein [Xanthomonadales bacterium]NNK51047.1 FHA domain-containing protein [Xanthomonadales bacterium]